MSQHTDIQWCDSTVNPVMGCDGCELWVPARGVRICYAGRLHATRGKTNSGFARNFDEPQMFAGRMAKAAGWADLAGQVRPDKLWLNGMPRTIFVSDMGDALSTPISFEYLRREITDVAVTPPGRRHIWQWLTKQPGRMAEFSSWLQERGLSWPENLWAGTSVTTAATVNRVKALLRVGSENTTRFLSVEPQWAEIDLAEWLPKLGWVIQGGQSGKDPRPFDIAWARSMRDAARRAGVPYFLKQLGAHPIERGRRLRLRDTHGGEWAEWPEDLRVREMPRPVASAVRSPPSADDRVPTIQSAHERGRRHLPVVQAAEAPSNPEPPAAGSAAEVTSELALYLRAERVEDPEARWELWRTWFLGRGSVLFRWVALGSMHAAFWRRDPQIVLGYVPRRARGRKIASLAIFFHALRNDTGIAPRTAYREIEYATALVKALGQERVLSLLGTRAANDARFLRDLCRLRNPTQVEDVTTIYTEGAGEEPAKERLDLYLDIQADRDARQQGSGKQGGDPAEPPSPTAPLGPKPDPRQTLLALGVRLRDVLEVVVVELELAKEEIAIRKELVELRAELQAAEPAVGANRHAAPAEVLDVDSAKPPLDPAAATRSASARVVEPATNEPKSSEPERPSSPYPEAPHVDPPPPGATHVVRFVARAEDIAAAVAQVSVVEPPGASHDGIAGLLFTVGDDGSGVPYGCISVRDAEQSAVARFPVRCVDSPGSFAFPAARGGAFQHLPGEDLAFCAYSMLGNALPRYVVEVESTNGASFELAHDIDPQMLHDRSRALDGRPVTRFNAAVLRAVLEAAFPFFGKQRADADRQVLQIVHARSDGMALAGDGKGAVWFLCDGLLGRDLIVHRTQVDGFLSFLKSCSGDADVIAGPRFSVAASTGRRFTWTRSESALTIHRDEPWSDDLTLWVHRIRVVNLLRRAKALLPKRRGVIRVSYAPGDQTLRFVVTTTRTNVSPPVSVRPAPGSPPGVDISLHVDVDAFVRLLDRIRSNEVELHLGHFNTTPEQTIVRTVEDVQAGGQTCRVTRSCVTVAEPAPPPRPPAPKWRPLPPPARLVPREVACRCGHEFDGHRRAPAHPRHNEYCPVGCDLDERFNFACSVCDCEGYDPIDGDGG